MNAKSLLSIVLAVAVLGGAVAVWFLTKTGQEDANAPGDGSIRRASTSRGRTSTNSGGDATTDTVGSDSPSGPAVSGAGDPSTGTQFPNVPSETHPPAISPEKAVADALTLAAQQVNSGNVAAAKGTLATIQKHRPLSAFESVTRELVALGNYPFRTLLLAALDDPADHVAIFKLFRESSDRYGKGVRDPDWREGEAGWLEALAARALPGAAASPDGIEAFSVMLGQTRLVRVVDAVLARMGMLEQAALEPWIPALRAAATGGHPRDTRLAAATLMLRAAPDAGARMALLGDSALADVRRAMLGVVLRDGLVPAADVVGLARDEVVAASQSRDTQSDAKTLFEAIAAADPAAGLALARELRPQTAMPGSLRVAVLTSVARDGSDQERAELVDQAKATGAEARNAFEALVAAGVPLELEDIYLGALYPVVQVLALERLAAGESRMKWIEDGLQPAKLRPLRVGAAALLDARVAEERARLVQLGETDRDPEVRKRVMQSLGGLKDNSLLDFFDSRARADEDPTIRSLAAGYAKALRGE